MTNTNNQSTWKTAIAVTPSLSTLFTILVRPVRIPYLIGLIARNVYQPSTDLSSKRGGAAYLLNCVDGALFNSGNKDAFMPAVAQGSTVRFVRNMAAATISIHVNNVDAGVKFRDVPAGELYAVFNVSCCGINPSLPQRKVCFEFPNISRSLPPLPIPCPSPITLTKP